MNAKPTPTTEKLRDRLRRLNADYEAYTTEHPDPDPEGNETADGKTHTEHLRTAYHIPAARALRRLERAYAKQLRCPDCGGPLEPEPDYRQTLLEAVEESRDGWGTGYDELSLGLTCTDCDLSLHYEQDGTDHHAADRDKA